MTPEQQHQRDILARLRKRGEQLDELAAAEITRLATSLAEAEKWVARLDEALTSSENTKAAYIGEFEMGVLLSDRQGNQQKRSISIDWVTIKKIMAAIKARALPTGGE